MRVTKQDLIDIWTTQYIENEPNEMYSLVRWVETHTTPLNASIEIGVAYGGSLHIWEKMVPPGGLVVGIDASPETEARITGKVRCGSHTHSMPDTTRYGTWKLRGKEGNLLRLESDREVWVIVGDSSSPETAAKVATILDGRKFDYYFHDGAHFGPTPITDFQTYYPMIREGGTLCLGDIGYVGPPEHGPPVANSGIQALYHFLQGPKHVVLPGNQGMGLWQKPTGPMPDVSPILLGNFPPYRLD